MGGLCIIYTSSLQEKNNEPKDEESLAYIHVGNTPVFSARSQDGADKITQRQGCPEHSTSRDHKSTYLFHSVFVAAQQRCYSQFV